MPLDEERIPLDECEDEDLFGEPSPEKEPTVVHMTAPVGVRLDASLASFCGITRSAAEKLFEDGAVLTEKGEAVAKSLKPKVPLPLVVRIPQAKECAAEPENIPVEIVYEDEDLLIVNKPRGMVVHPAPGNYTGTLVNALLYHCRGRLSGIGGVIRPGIVHRIDKDTSGLLIVAKNDEAHTRLAAQIKEHSFTRIYHAVVYGNLKEDSGTLDFPIGRSPKDRKKMAVTTVGSRPALTRYQVLARYRDFTYVELTLETGRTHQIRVHMAHIGHPVVGDPLYAPHEGRNPFGLVGQCLHAKYIGFAHPRDGREVTFDSELPPYFKAVLDTLEKRGQIN